MKILYTITKDGEGFVAVCQNKNIVTQGKTLDEVVNNLKEAIELHLRSEKELK